LGSARPIDKATAKCGTNRYVGVKNYLEFYMNPGCQLSIIPRDVVMTSVRMEWKLSEFYEDDGVSKLVDRVASVLGIHPSRVKVVSVYEGSVVADFWTEVEENDPDPFASATALEAKLQAVIAANPTALGAPVLHM
jgi:hypothetical protein